MIPFDHKAFVFVAHFAKIWESKGSQPPTYVQSLQDGDSSGADEEAFFRIMAVWRFPPLVQWLFHPSYPFTFGQKKGWNVTKQRSARISGRPPKLSLVMNSRAANARAVPPRACLLLPPLVPRHRHEWTGGDWNDRYRPFQVSGYTNSIRESGLEAWKENIDHRILKNAESTINKHSLKNETTHHHDNDDHTFSKQLSLAIFCWMRSDPGPTHLTSMSFWGSPIVATFEEGLSKKKKTLN